MLAAVRTASRDDAMHRAVIAVAAGTAVAMLAVRQRAIRNAIASALTVRPRRDGTTTRDDADGIARGSDGGGVDARADVAWIESGGRGGDAGDATRVSRERGSAARGDAARGETRGARVGAIGRVRVSRGDVELRR